MVEVSVGALKVVYPKIEAFVPPEGVTASLIVDVLCDNAELNVAELLTNIAPPIPTPPVTFSAPVVLDDETVLFVMDTTPEEISPLKVPRDVMVGCAAVTATVLLVMLIPDPAVSLG